MVLVLKNLQGLGLVGDGLNYITALQVSVCPSTIRKCAEAIFFM